MLLVMQCLKTRCLFGIFWTKDCVPTENKPNDKTYDAETPRCHLARKLASMLGNWTQFDMWLQDLTVRQMIGDLCRTLQNFQLCGQ